MHKRKIPADSDCTQRTDTSSDSSASDLADSGPELLWPQADTFRSAEQAQTDPGCIWCDDGGTVAPCDGLCMRSFHMGIELTEPAGGGPGTKTFGKNLCNPLELPKDLALHLIEDDVFFECPSCFANIHHCFECKAEGDANINQAATDKTVARCAMITCGRFYHPRCIDKTPEQIGTADFICPRHTCRMRLQNGLCNVPMAASKELIECRRCPVAYHRECLPKAIMDTVGQKNQKRVWFQGEEVDKSLIYCMKHEIPAGQDNPPLESPLFSSELLVKWRSGMCRQYPNLQSSGLWLKKTQPKNIRGARQSSLRRKEPH